MQFYCEISHRESMQWAILLLGLAIMNLYARLLYYEDKPKA